MDRRLILCFFLCSTVLSLAQSPRISIKGIVRDSSTMLPLPDVNIAIQGVPFTGTSTEMNGSFTLEVDSLPLYLIISSIGFKTQIIQIHKKETIKIYLTPSSINLSDIVVRARPKIDTVFNEPYNVVDFLFEQDNLLLLVYRSISDKYELVLLNEFEQPIDRLPLRKERPISLFKSCVDSLYLNTYYGVYRLHVADKNIQLGEPILKQKFEQFIKPCLLARDSLLFFQQYFYQGQAVHFYSLVVPITSGTSADRDSLVFLPCIEDEQQIIRLIEDAGYRLPWSGDFWDDRITGGLLSLREGPYVLKGVMRMYYPKLYIPLFSVGDDLCIINHFSSRIQYFNARGYLLREIPITYHHSKRWKKVILQDKNTQRIYTAFHSRWGEYICPIDPKNGTLGEAVEVAIDFSEKLYIKNGVLYFLHRNPYSGVRNKMLKKINLN
jgi:hypothetical protein